MNRVLPPLAFAGVHWFWFVFWLVAFWPALFFVWRRHVEKQAEAREAFIAANFGDVRRWADTPPEFESGFDGAVRGFGHAIIALIILAVVGGLVAGLTSP